MKKPVKKQPNSINVSEFKSWMSGVEDMQADGWVPNKQQWDRIRSKIALLSDETVEVIRQPEVPEPTPQTSAPRNNIPDRYPVLDSSPEFTNNQQLPSFNMPAIGTRPLGGVGLGPSFEPLNPTPVQVQSGALSYVNGDLPDFL